MAKQLDLEEQEQLAEIKHFWNEYGNLISWAVIVVFGALAAGSTGSARRRPRPRACTTRSNARRRPAT